MNFAPAAAAAVVVAAKRPASTASSKRTCVKCGGRLIRDWSGWMHARKPDRPHRPKPAPKEETR